MSFDVETIGCFTGAGVGLKVGHVVGSIMVGEIVAGLEGGAVVGCVVVGGTSAFSSVMS
jgi:hypothetical protein